MVWVVPLDIVWWSGNMRYFAEVDKDNKVINVIQAEDEEFIKTLGSSYIETFESETVIGARADKGYTYDTSKKAFLPPQPYSSWVFDENTNTYEAPVTYPTDSKQYKWNEEDQTWDAVPS
jgi:hypothetical protein